MLLRVVDTEHCRPVHPRATYCTSFWQWFWDCWATHGTRWADTTEPWTW